VVAKERIRALVGKETPVIQFQAGTLPPRPLYSYMPENRGLKTYEREKCLRTPIFGIISE
jgi:hypothetical protein